MFIPKHYLHESEHLNIYITRQSWNNFRVESYIRTEPNVRKCRHVGLFSYLILRLWFRLYRWSIEK